jgi:hypothetical protein
MRCPALGVSVAFLKQPTLPGKEPQTKKIKNIIQKNKNKNKTSLIKHHK